MNLTAERHKGNSLAVNPKETSVVLAVSQWVSQSQYTTVLKSYLYVNNHFFTSSVWICPRHICLLCTSSLLCKLPDEVWS